jgi:hypothetical protein
MCFFVDFAQNDFYKVPYDRNMFWADSQVFYSSDKYGVRQSILIASLEWMKKNYAYWTNSESKEININSPELKAKLHS